MARLKTIGSRLSALRPRLSGGKRADPIYTDPLYVDWREDVFARYGRRCIVPDCETPDDRVTADHVVEIKDGGEPFNVENGRPFCHRHHLIKTHAARKLRAQGNPHGRGGEV